MDMIYSEEENTSKYLTLSEVLGILYCETEKDRTLYPLDLVLLDCLPSHVIFIKYLR